MQGSILFVCSGNICRSPMAEVLARRELAPTARIASAGTLGIVGRPADPHSVRAVAELGLDLTRHRSCALTRELALDHATIVVMASEHTRFVASLDPALEGRIVPLWHFAQRPGNWHEIPDPIGCDLGTFIDCRDLIHECLHAFLRTRHGAPA